MKKLLFILVFFLLVQNVKAINYTIDGFYVDATILENGDMLVKEAIVQRGTFNGYYRVLFPDSDYSKYNASSIELIRICESNFSDFSATSNYTNCFKEVYYGRNGESLVYEKKAYRNGIQYKMFNYSNNSSKTYYIEYILKNVAIKYNDIGEVRWNFIGDLFLDRLKDVKIKISLEKESKLLRVWSHGPLYGETEIIDSKSVQYLATDLESRKAVDVRVVFDSELLGYVKKTYSNEMFDSIIKEETILADEANKEREAAQKELILMRKKIINTTITIIGLSIVAFFLPFLYVYYYNNLKYKKSFHQKYLRDFPDDSSPELVQQIMYSKIDSIGLSSSLLNIIRKKGLVVEEFMIIRGTFNRKKEKDYKLILNDVNISEPLTEGETFLRNWFLEQYGDKISFVLSDLKEKTKKEIKALYFTINYDKWKDLVVVNKSILKKKYRTVKQILLISFVCIVLLNLDSIYTLYFFFISLSLFFGFKYKPSIAEIGDSYFKWKAFRNFLKDFSKFNETQLPEVNLWEKYLVYANIFGLADKLKKQMDIKIQNIDINQDDFFDKVERINLVNHNLKTSISKAYFSSRSHDSRLTSIKRISSSRRSSGGGSSRGGSSRGGGRGGGGGGGGGF